MQYSVFVKTIKPSDVVESVRVYGHSIELHEDGSVFIDKQKTEIESLEEARSYIKNKHLFEQIEKEISTELYEEISDHKVANIIKEHHDVKVTDTLIEQYIQLASSRIFSVDPVVQEVRKLNKLDTIVEGKIHYVLDDESIVAISESTQEQLNNLLQNQIEIVQHMRESKENFMQVLGMLEE